MNFFSLLSLSSSVLLFQSCTISVAENRYKGYQNAMDIAHITSVPGKKTDHLLDVNIPPSNSTTFDYNKNLKDIYFVKLETTEKSRIPGIDKLLLTRNRIVAVDFNISRTVYIFDSSGRFVNNITADKSFDNTRDAVSNFLDVTYDYTSDEIVLHDQMNCRSFYFNTDGHYIKRTKEYLYFANFVNLKNTDKYVYINAFGGNDHIPILKNSSLYIGKKNTEIVYTATDAIKNMRTDVNYRINLNPSFNNSNAKVFYTPEFSDTVYQIDADPVNVSAKLVIHFPGTDINTKIKASKREGIQEYIRLLNMNSYYSFKGEVFCNNDSVYYIATYKKGVAGYFYSERTNTIIGGNLVSTVLSKDSAQIEGYRYPITSFNDYFVSVLAFPDFGKSKWLCSEKLSIVEKGVKPTDNPILAFYKLKQF